MSITIHHGDNGSYKTSGVVEEFLIPAILSGRTVVTNIRGVSTENCFDLFDDAHQDFNVIHVDTEREEGRQKIATWWHWVPLGALLIFDEAGVLFPKRWRDSDIKKLDYPQGSEEGRPITWIEAWEMHRHYNWDIILSAPSIKSIREDIRNTTESAFKHKNRALLGSFLKGSYNLGMHSAETNGTQPSHFMWVKPRRIKDERVFKLYKSTKTGQHSDTLNASSIFNNGRLLLSLVVAISALGYSLYGFTYGGAFSYETEIDSGELGQAVPIVPETTFNQVPDIPDRNLDSIPVNQTYSLEPFTGHTFKIASFVENTERYIYHFTASKGSDSFLLSSDELIRAGYSVLKITECAATIVFKTIRYNVTCQDGTIREDARGA